MSKKWLWLTIAAVAVGGFAAGMVVAQEEEWDFDFLPASYAESHTPTLVEWREVQFNALEPRRAYLTDRLRQIRCVLSVTEWGIALVVYTSTQPGWDMYLGDGAWACSDEEVKTTYAEAVEEIADSVRNYFPVADDEALNIEFWIEDRVVAGWEYGIMYVGDELIFFELFPW